MCIGENSAAFRYVPREPDALPVALWARYALFYNQSFAIKQQR